MAELPKAKVAPAFNSAEQIGLKSAALDQNNIRDGNNLPTFTKPCIDTTIDGYQVTYSQKKNVYSAFRACLK